MPIDEAKMATDADDYGGGDEIDGGGEMERYVGRGSTRDNGNEIGLDRQPTEVVG